MATKIDGFWNGMIKPAESVGVDVEAMKRDPLLHAIARSGGEHGLLWVLNYMICALWKSRNECREQLLASLQRNASPISIASPVPSLELLEAVKRMEAKLNSLAEMATHPVVMEYNPGEIIPDAEATRRAVERLASVPTMAIPHDTARVARWNGVPMPDHLDRVAAKMAEANLTVERYAYQWDFDVEGYATNFRKVEAILGMNGWYVREFDVSPSFRCIDHVNGFKTTLIIEGKDRIVFGQRPDKSRPYHLSTSSRLNIDDCCRLGVKVGADVTPSQNVGRRHSLGADPEYHKKVSSILGSEVSDKPAPKIPVGFLTPASPPTYFPSQKKDPETNSDDVDVPVTIAFDGRVTHTEER